MLTTSSKSEKNEVARLKELARELRRDIVTMVHEAGSGHCGGSMSSSRRERRRTWRIARSA